MLHKSNHTPHQKSLLVLTPFFHPHTGGVEKHVLKTSLLLQKQGWQLTIITQQLDLSLPTQKQVQGLTVNRFSFPKVKLFGLIAIWLKLLTQYFSLFLKAEIVHVHDVMLWCLPLRLLFPGKKFVLTMHGWEGTYPIPKKNIWLKRLSALMANQVVSVGSYINKYYGIKPNAVIEGAISTQMATKPFLKKSSKPVKLIFLGRLAHDTGLPILLSAVKQLSSQQKSNLELIFIGDGPLKTECGQVGQALGWQSEQQTSQQLVQAQFCFAGGYLSAIEAMALGCVVLVATQNPVKKDYRQMSKLRDKLVTINNSEELIKVFNKPQSLLLTEKIKQNMAWAKQQSWDEIAQLYLKIYSTF